MNGTQLPKHFFEDNPLVELSVTQVSYFYMLMIMDDKMTDEMNALAIPRMDIEGQKEYTEEKTDEDYGQDPLLALYPIYGKQCNRVGFGRTGDCEIVGDIQS